MVDEVRQEFMVYYTRVTDDENEIEMRICLEAESEEDVLGLARIMLRGRVFRLRAELCGTCKPPR
jgi:hypothetical protein